MLGDAAIPVGHTAASVAAALDDLDAETVHAAAIAALRAAGWLTTDPETGAVERSEIVKGFEIDTWWGLVAPAGTPKAVVLVGDLSHT